MVPNAVATVTKAKEDGKRIAGIFCEYTPRELFWAADILPVCMCGGQQATIPEAEKELPVNLCPLIKSSYGHFRSRKNPFMEMADLYVAETTCDGKKKMFELMARKRPFHVLELPQKPDSEAAFAHWLGEVSSLKARLEDLGGQPMTHESLLAAIERMNEERDLRREIAYLAADDPPLLSGTEILMARSSVSLIPCDLQGYRDIIDWARRRSSPFSGRTRILLTGVPCPTGAEKVVRIVEERGGVVVAQENCSGIKPIMDNVSTKGDLLSNIARKYFALPCSCMTPNTRRFDLLTILVRDFAPSGIIELVWQACHTYNVEAELVRREAESRWELPYLKLETDYSPSDGAQLAVRVEAFLEICRERGAGKGRAAALGPPS